MFRLPVVAVALIFLGFLGLPTSVASQAPARGVKIVQPKAGDPVTQSSVTASGMYSSDVSDDIWVLVWPEKAPGKAWPQSIEAKQGRPAAKRNGTWSVPCALGGPAQNYEITVYTATKAASDALAKTLREWAFKNDYPGLLDLPAGLTERDKVTISKK